MFVCLSLKFELITRTIVDGDDLLCFSWAAIPQWKVFFTVSLIMSSSSRRLAPSRRTSRHVCLFFSSSMMKLILLIFELDASLIANNLILNSCKVSWQDNSWAGKFVWFYLYSFFLSKSGLQHSVLLNNY